MVKCCFKWTADRKEQFDKAHEMWWITGLELIQKISLMASVQMAVIFIIRILKIFTFDEGDWIYSFHYAIQWSRLIKDFETGEADPKGYGILTLLLKEAKKKRNDIELVLWLHRLSICQLNCFKNMAVWESKHVVDLFVKFAKTAFECFGRVRFITGQLSNDNGHSEAGYLYAFPLSEPKKGKERSCSSDL